VQIDVKHGGTTRLLDHHVFVPDLFEKRLCHAHSAAPVVCSRTCDFSACFSYVPRVTSKRLSAPMYALVLATMTSESAACPCKIAAPPLPCCALRRPSLLPTARTRTLAWPSASMPSVTALMLYSRSSLGACTISSTAVKAACTGPVPTAACTRSFPSGQRKRTVAVGKPVEPQVTCTASSAKYSTPRPDSDAASASRSASVMVFFLSARALKRWKAASKASPSRA